MDKTDIHQHWTDWASTFGTALRATTKTWTAKAIEVDALTRRITGLLGPAASGRVLEVGCGNGVNCIELAGRFPGLAFDGIDYVQEMVEAAKQNAAASPAAARLRFQQGDALAIDGHPGLDGLYDIVFTDRCLINLNTPDLQEKAIAALSRRLKPGGHLLMIENSRQTYDEQNRCRTLLGLPPRVPASFNLFFDEARIRPHLAALGLELLDVEDFISLHDIVLYALVPAINGGEVDYGHPLVEAATKLSIALSADRPGAFGAFGQNRLFVARRPG